MVDIRDRLCGVPVIPNRVGVETVIVGPGRWGDPSAKRLDLEEWVAEKPLPLFTRGAQREETPRGPTH